MYNFTTLQVSKLDNGWVLQYTYTGEIENDGKTQVISGALAFPNLNMLTNWVLSNSSEKAPQVVHAKPIPDEQEKNEGSGFKAKPSTQHLYDVSKVKK